MDLWLFWSTEKYRNVILWFPRLCRRKDTAFAWLSLFGMHSLGNLDTPLKEDQTIPVGEITRRDICGKKLELSKPTASNNCQTYEWTSLQMIPASYFMEQREAILAVPCQNSWSTESVSIITDCFMPLNLGLNCHT